MDSVYLYIRTHFCENFLIEKIHKMNQHLMLRLCEAKLNFLHTGTPISATRRWLLVSFSTELIC